nr:MAG TPA: hypothetical protein [Bacteriophage sp.]
MELRPLHFYARRSNLVHWYFFVWHFVDGIPLP